MAALLLLRHRLCDRNENIDREQPHTILVIRRKMLKQRDHLINDNRCRHALDKFRKIVCSLSPDHWCVVFDELCELLAQPLL